MSISAYSVKKGFWSFRITKRNSPIVDCPHFVPELSLHFGIGELGKDGVSEVIWSNFQCDQCWIEADSYRNWNLKLSIWDRRLQVVTLSNSYVYRCELRTTLLKELNLHCVWFDASYASRTSHKGVRGFTPHPHRTKHTLLFYLRQQQKKNWIVVVIYN